MAEPQLLSTDPHAAELLSTDPTAGREPSAHLSAPDPDRPVTLGDIQDNPRLAMERIGGILKKDLTDPKLWLSAAAMYFGPKAFNVAAPVVARAARSAPEMAIRGTAAVGDVVSPDIVGVLSPRAGKVLDLAQRMRAKLPERPAPAPPATAPAPVAATPAAVAAAPVSSPPVAQAPPAAPTAGTAGPPPMPVATASAPPPTVEAPPMPKVTLRAAEAKEYLRLLKAGKSSSEAMQLIEAQRALVARLGLPSSETVRGSVAERNVTGRWSTEP